MKSKILGLLALGLLAGPMAANAVVVNVGDAAYKVTTQTCAYDEPDCATLLQDQFWWGSPALAIEFAMAVGGLLGFTDLAGPRFAYAYDDASQCGLGVVCNVFLFEGNTSVTLSATPPSITRDYAIAERAGSIPEPGSLALLGLGLAGLGLSRRRKA